MLDIFDILKLDSLKGRTITWKIPDTFPDDNFKAYYGTIVKGILTDIELNAYKGVHDRLGIMMYISTEKDWGFRLTYEYAKDIVFHPPVKLADIIDCEQLVGKVFLDEELGRRVQIIGTYYLFSSKYSDNNIKGLRGLVAELGVEKGYAPIHWNKLTPIQEP